MPMVITPMGTLMKKIQPQCRCWLMKPPISGPKARASAPMADTAPIAVARSLALSNVAMMMASVAGTSIAAPRPWNTRAPISTPPLPASPAASEDSVNTDRPATKNRRRPKTSASRPPASSSPANTRM